ncbi:MAG: leucine-rich repeat domain-containing protein [Sedimentisphaerales bacterium]|nr:leucine-rich repeat domain-containing protein [Sedimentisphaerales bacterium]
MLEGKVKRALLAVLLSCVLHGWVRAEDPVYFPDARLKAAVEDALWVWDPTATDMLGLTSLDAASHGISNLGGLEYAVNLQTLVLRWNRISDISALSALVNLQWLDIHDNEISDLSPLSGLSELRTLVLRFNRIRDISALTGLTALEQLDLRGNPLDEQAFETHLPQILANNPGIDLSYDAFSQCILLVSSTAGGSVLQPGEGQFVYDNGVTVYLEARADPGYVFTGFSGSFSSTANPTFLLMDANHNVRAEFARAGDANAPLEAVYFTDGALEAAVEEALSVADPTPSDMLGLTELACADRGIVSLTGLDYATNLRTLDLSGNQVSDISSLAALTSLVSLDLRGNPLSRETYAVSLPLIAANNPDVELRYDPPVQRRVSIHSTLGGRVTRPGEGSFTYDDGETIVLRAQADPGFTFVAWSGSYAVTANPTSLIVEADHEIEAVFAPAFDTQFVDANAPGDPGPDDPEVSDPQEDGSLEHPFDTIQEAIDGATDGATVIVGSGRYRETINLRGKNLHLVGLDPHGRQMAVIDGSGAGPVVSFVNGEDPNCLLSGFVITGGRDEEVGAVVCTAASPSLANCLIVGNRATGAQGAAVRCRDSQAVFVNCTIADNVGGLLLIDSHVVVTGSIVWDPMALAGVSKPSITYCDIAGGWPDKGNIDTDPLFAEPGTWSEPDDADAVWVEGDYHLKSQSGRWDPKARVWVADNVTSPCIDAGSPAGPVGLEPPPHGGIINLGAYGGTAQASKSKFTP